VTLILNIKVNEYSFLSELPKYFLKGSLSAQN